MALIQISTWLGKITDGYSVVVCEYILSLIYTNNYTTGVSAFKKNLNVQKITEYT